MNCLFCCCLPVFSRYNYTKFHLLTLDLLKSLCTHRYPVDQAEKAVQVLGREVVDGAEAVHVHIDAAATT